MSNSCILWPEVNGKESRLYKELLRVIKNRPLVNWLYASYIASNIGDAMDQAGYTRDSVGQHKAADFMKFIDYSTIANQIGSLHSEEIQLGAVDNNGQRVDFTDASDALKRADDFNDTHQGLVANVYQHGDVFNIIVSEKNAKTHMFPTEVKERIAVWDAIKQAFMGNGIDIENMPQEIRDVINPNNIHLMQDLKNLHLSRFNYIFRKQALELFNLNANSHHIRNLIPVFGSLENAAQAVDDLNHGVGNYTSAQQRLLLRAVNDSIQFNGINLTALENQVNQISQQTISSSPEESVRSTLHKLNKKYHIDINEVHRTTDKIKALSDAATEAAFNLQRRIRELEKQRGNNAEGKRLTDILNQLLNELANKRYYSGIVNYLNEAMLQVNDIDNMIQAMPQTGTEIEKAFGKAETLQQIKSMYEQYYPIVSALADEHLTIDEAIGQTDINNIRQAAQSILKILKEKENVVDELVENNMINLMTQIVGDTAPDGQVIANVIKMAQKDSTMWDWLYSVGRASNPIIGAMGSIIRNAQDARDYKLNNISLRIRRATDKLYKAGFNSEFMYEDNGHIISDINWELYDSARKDAIKALYRQGLRDFDLKQAIENWEDANTEDRIVDHTNGRTERVPNQNYRKAFPTLTQVQQEYYDTMMQIKGEIGSLLPAYAQQQYLPPQLRRDMLDAIGHAKNAKDVLKAIQTKFENVWKIREDDTNYNLNGRRVGKRIIDGEEFDIVDSDYDNTPLREIPIFYINKVDQAELLKNFSTGLQALAGTAINYDAMNSVAQVVEFIGDFAKSQLGRDKDPKADHVGNKLVSVTKDLYKWGRVNGNSNNIIDGYIAQHIFGQKLDPNQFGYKWAKLVSNLIGYTSFKGLATNLKGAFSNYLVGEFQMLIEAGAGEFYGLKDYMWAHTRLFGGAGVGGEIAELLTNNVNHKGVLFRELFDPINENFSDKSHTKYHKSMFRQLVGHDCAFLGYASGEYLIHYVNMYSILHNQKVKLNGKTISLYDAFEVVNKKEGNSELQLKAGVTTLDGQPITQEWLDKIRKRIRYVNQTTHGSMNEEDKGLIHQKLWGRAVMNFRQWAVEHYSRRFRKSHYDATLEGFTYEDGTPMSNREGYWRSFFNYLFNEETKEQWGKQKFKDIKNLEDAKDFLKNRGSIIGTTLGESVSMVLPWFMRDYMTFMLRAQTQWSNLSEMQRYNVKRVHSEMMMFVALLGLSFALGEPEDHKREFWRRWWIYQVKRMLLETEASMPHPKAISSGLTMLQSPMAGINTLNNLMYAFYGVYNGDLATSMKSGPFKGWNKYLLYNIRYNAPFWKDWEQMQKMGESDTIFQVFKDTPKNY